jgi:hydroxyacyl-ACP dehydratase HTD2-like protein with hotdog domain
MSRIDDVSPEDRFVLEKTPTRPQLFRYSAITWNPHRIHYDPEHAREEGHPDVLVQAHLHGAVIQQLLLDEFGPDGRLVELSWRNVGRAVPGEVLRAVAEVTAVDAADGRVEFDVRTENEADSCADGHAAIVFD